MRAMGGSPMVFVSRRPDGQSRIPEDALTDYQDHLEDSYDQAVRESNRRAALEGAQGIGTLLDERDQPAN